MNLLTSLCLAFAILINVHTYINERGTEQHAEIYIEGTKGFEKLCSKGRTILEKNIPADELIFDEDCDSYCCCADCEEVEA